MRTPICDFVKEYARAHPHRLHMPGHKGVGPLGIEERDITEIGGADSLYEAQGIIRESEGNASRLFGAHTFYSTEGSSLCVRAMLYLACLHATEQGRRPRIAAGRNAHKSFLSAAACLDFAVQWLYPSGANSYLSCPLTDADIEAALTVQEKPTAVYITSPDYLGNTVDIAAIANLCRRHEVLLLVDNAHGAYRKFLPHSQHPMDQGADLCCDSAHKTLPVLTGGAYLHIRRGAPAVLTANAKEALAFFGSTSPSYLILQSLDAVNPLLNGELPPRLAQTACELDCLKEKLVAHGYTLIGDETLKLTVAPKGYGYTGTQLADALADKGLVCEFADPDYTVMLFAAGTPGETLQQLENALFSLPRQEEIDVKPPTFTTCESIISAREAALAPRETLRTERCAGRILAAATVGCPPAVPPVMAGERIREETIHLLEYYDIRTLTVVKE